jgi:hypothetical protein
VAVTEKSEARLHLSALERDCEFASLRCEFGRSSQAQESMTAAVTKTVLRLSRVETQLEVLSVTKKAFALYFRMRRHLSGKSISSFGSGSTSDIGPDRTGRRSSQVP